MFELIIDPKRINFSLLPETDARTFTADETGEFYFPLAKFKKDYSILSEFTDNITINGQDPFLKNIKVDREVYKNSSNDDKLMTFHDKLYREGFESFEPNEIENIIDSFSQFLATYLQVILDLHFANNVAGTRLSIFKKPANPVIRFDYTKNETGVFFSANYVLAEMDTNTGEKTPSITCEIKHQITNKGARLIAPVIKSNDKDQLIKYASALMTPSLATKKSKQDLNITGNTDDNLEALKELKITHKKLNELLSTLPQEDDNVSIATIIAKRVGYTLEDNTSSEIKKNLAIIKQTKWFILNKKLENELQQAKLQAMTLANELEKLPNESPANIDKVMFAQIIARIINSNLTHASPTEVRKYLTILEQTKLLAQNEKLTDEIRISYIQTAMDLVDQEKADISNASNNDKLHKAMMGLCHPTQAEIKSAEANAQVLAVKSARALENLDYENLTVTGELKDNIRQAYIQAAVDHSDKILSEAMLLFCEANHKEEAAARVPLIKKALEDLEQSSNLKNAYNNLNRLLSHLPPSDDKITLAKRVVKILKDTPPSSRVNHLEIVKQTGKLAAGKIDVAQAYLANAKKVHRNHALRNAMLGLCGLCLIGVSVGVAILTHGASTPLSVAGVKIGVSLLTPMVYSVAALGATITASALGLFTRNHASRKEILQENMHELARKVSPSVGKITA